MNLDPRRIQSFGYNSGWCNVTEGSVASVTFLEYSLVDEFGFLFGSGGSGTLNQRLPSDLFKVQMHV